MHGTEALRPDVVEDPDLLARRLRARARAEAVEAVLAVAALAIIIGMLAGWSLPV